MLILLPPILMLTYPSFRRTLERPRELAIYISLGIVLLAFGVWHSFKTGSDQVMSMESWMLVGTAGLLMVIRNGVSGIIIANIAMAAATIAVQIVICNNTLWLTPRMLVEFNLYTCHLTGLSLILAAGLYDYKLINNIFHDTTTGMLETQIKERNRIAADLHDSVSQEFAAALMYLRSGMQGSPATIGKDDFKCAEDSLVKGIQDLRQVAAGLRPEMLERDAFTVILESYCTTFEARHAIEVLFEDETPPDMPPLSLNKREHLFRIMQESLGNAVRHGHAQTVSVRLYLSEKQTKIILRIADDGIGFDMAAGIDMSDHPHLGLRLMQERILMVGETFSIDSAPGEGTVVEVRVPVAETA